MGRYDGHCRAVRIGLLGSRYSEISTVPMLLNRLGAMSFGTTRQRTVCVGAAHGKTNRPGIDRCAAPGANDNLNFRVALRAPAQCRHVTGEGYLNFAGRLVAQERNRHIGEFKPAFVRAASGAPDELLPFLHRFLQGPGDWRDVEDRRLLDRHGIRRRLGRLARLREWKFITVLAIAQSPSKCEEACIPRCAPESIGPPMPHSWGSRSRAPHPQPF